MLTQCPQCKDTAIVQRERAPGVFVWVAGGWRDDDGLEVEIDYCPSCGVELLDSDECGELLDSFDGETEARFCALLKESEAARLRGDLMSWQFGVDPDIGWVKIQLRTGQVIESNAATLSEAIAELSRKLLGWMVLPKA